MSDTAENLLNSFAFEVLREQDFDVHEEVPTYPAGLLLKARLQLYEDIASEVIGADVAHQDDETHKCSHLKNPLDRYCNCGMANQIILQSKQREALRKYFRIEPDVPTQDTEGGK